MTKKEAKARRKALVAGTALFLLLFGLLVAFIVQCRNSSAKKKTQDDQDNSVQKNDTPRPNNDQDAVIIDTHQISIDGQKKKGIGKAD